MTTWVSLVAAGVAIVVAAMQIAYNVYANAQRLAQEMDLKKRITEHEAMLKARAEIFSLKIKEKSETLSLFADALKALQAFKDALSRILDASQRPGSHDSSTALTDVASARKGIELAHAELSARVDADDIQTIHAAKRLAQQIEPQLRSFMKSQEFVPTLNEAQSKELSETKEALTQAIARLRDVLVVQNHQLTAQIIKNANNSLD